MARLDLDLHFELHLIGHLHRDIPVTVVHADLVVALKLIGDLAQPFGGLLTRH